MDAVQVSDEGFLLLHDLRVGYILLLMGALQASPLVCAVLNIPLRQLTHTSPPFSPVLPVPLSN